VTASAEVVLAALKKCLPEGRLPRVPRNPEHRDIVLAALCLDMRRRYPYSEIEFNDYLKGALAGLNARVDHVTCRRYLVDFGFVKRDRAGTRYFLYLPKVRATLCGEAMASIDALLEEAIAFRKAQVGGRHRA